MLYFRFTAPWMEYATAFHVSDDLGSEIAPRLASSLAGGCAQRVVRCAIIARGRSPLTGGAASEVSWFTFR